MQRIISIQIDYRDLFFIFVCHLIQCIHLAQISLRCSKYLGPDMQILSVWSDKVKVMKYIWNSLPQMEQKVISKQIYLNCVIDKLIQNDFYFTIFIIFLLLFILIIFSLCFIVNIIFRVFFSSSSSSFKLIGLFACDFGLSLLVIHSFRTLQLHHYHFNFIFNNTV